MSGQVPRASWGIHGLGVHIPDRCVSNAEIAGQYGVDPAWIERMTGITQRGYAEPSQATSDLAFAAAEQALADAELSPRDIDVILLATSTPDQLAVATACRVQHRLGADRAWATDVGGACGGFLYALKMARDILSASYPDGHALVIGAEMFSKFQNPTDRSTGVLFADGAGAVVVGPAGEGTGILCSTQGTDGAFADIVGIGAGGSARPTSEHTLSEGGHYLHMNGKAVAPISTRSSRGSSRNSFSCPACPWTRSTWSSRIRQIRACCARSAPSWASRRPNSSSRQMFSATRVRLRSPWHCMRPDPKDGSSRETSYCTPQLAQE